jgi:hypothetical protein
MNKQKETHPCYGKIQISKFQGDSRFFGSDVNHRGGISIEISRASVERSLSKDWVFDEETLVHINLSPLQFAELITTGMNTDGVPCTIKRDAGGAVEQADFKDGIEEFKSEYDDTTEESARLITDALSVVDECLNGNTVKKKDVRVLKAKLEFALQHVRSNIPFVRKCFGRHINRSIVEAKTSVENFIESKIRHLGLKGLQDLAIEDSEVKQIREQTND